MIQSRNDKSSIAMTPDLTPLLDIIFIVMVFLLLTANISIKTLTLDIPSTDQVEVLESPTSQVIALSLLVGEPSWAIEETTYSNWESFANALLALHKKFPERAVVIASDKKVSVERMLQLLAFMQQNQINATNIMMDEQK